MRYSVYELGNIDFKIAMFTLESDAERFVKAMNNEFPHMKYLIKKEY